MQLASLEWFSLTPFFYPSLRTSKPVAMQYDLDELFNNGYRAIILKI